jgi:sensor histidine kinase regulating citrate/malate metabolism
VSILLLCYLFYYYFVFTVLNILLIIWLKYITDHLALSALRTAEQQAAVVAQTQAAREDVRVFLLFAALSTLCAAVLR